MSARKILETKLMVIKTFVAVLIYDFSIKYCDWNKIILSTIRFVFT